MPLSAIFNLKTQDSLNSNHSSRECYKIRIFFFFKKINYGILRWQNTVILLTSQLSILLVLKGIQIQIKYHYENLTNPQDFKQYNDILCFFHVSQKFNQELE